MAEFTKERIIEELKASTQNASGMFEISEDTICNLMSMLTSAAPQLPQPAVVPDFVGKLIGILDRHTIELGWGEKPITLAELVTSRDGEEELSACRAALLQGAEPEQGWIPCSERMPEFYFSVLVTDEHEDMVIALPVYLDAGDRCAFQLSNGDIFIATHWMPLPACPKGE